jgi:hypothetical protein
LGSAAATPRKTARLRVRPRPATARLAPRSLPPPRRLRPKGLRSSCPYRLPHSNKSVSLELARGPPRARRRFGFANLEALIGRSRVKPHAAT